jgi:hypothetical protein
MVRIGRPVRWGHVLGSVPAVRRNGAMRRVAEAVVLLCLVLTACCVRSPESVGEGEWHCAALPETFQESDLVGTWRAEYFAGAATDSLVLREDGTYRQVYENDLADYHYSSSWNAWYVERDPGGGVYLHLEQMHYCLTTDEICRLQEGGAGDDIVYDFCGDQGLGMRGRVILAVTGSEGISHPRAATAPRGIILVHMRTEPDRTISFFTIQQ